MSTRTRSALGVLFLLVGVAVLAVELWAHKTLSHFTGGAGLASTMFGALLVDPDAVVPALKALLGALKDLLPWKAGAGQPPEGPGV